MIFKNHIISTQEAIKMFFGDTSQFLDLNGLRIHYRDEGEGIPIVMLHGLSASLMNWDSVTEKLKNQYRIIRMDLPGFGLSDLNDPMDMNGFVVFLDQFLEALNIRNCYLVGSSMGGWISWEYTCFNSQRIDKLVLMNSAGFFDKGSKPPTYNIAKRPIFRKILGKGAPKLLVKKILGNAFYDASKLNPELIHRYYAMVNREGNLQNLLNLVQNELNPNVHKLPEINIPTLVIWGEKDSVMPLRNAFQFQLAIPNCELIVYPNVGHVPMEENPEKTSEDLIKFLNK